MAQAAENRLLIAAGGIITRPQDSGTGKWNVLLVHRPKYDDWSFPKGKAETGESLEQTAVREVREETGLTCKIVSKFAESRYSFSDKKGSPKQKLVHFFIMEPDEGEPFGDGEEIDRVEWVDLGEARIRLSYDADRLLIDALNNVCTGGTPWPPHCG